MNSVVKPLLKLKLLCVAMLLVQGCSIIQIESEAGIEEIRRFGVTIIKPVDGSRSVVTRRTNYGFAVDESSVLIGYNKEDQIFSTPDLCALYVLSEDAIYVDEYNDIESMLSRMKLTR